ncbi:ubiquitin-conjugating enzyme e2 s [Gigaspora margarita]|uniref:E2 ubiquitin-conjugating enzyme n=1 Tax=Gigaspora margarita TaxID=4874 RepID=A0A8H4ANL7_GIGMA|nr:ubiquitin-conjugating enzyme e2 s [Gigaspora margarita]
MSATENISPSVIKRITKELDALRTHPPEGIRVVMNELNICDVQAWISGPESTPYEGGFFKVKVVFGTDFPTVPPKCNFITKIFHPNVSKTGEVCVDTLKRDWNKDYGIEHILLTIKCLLIVPNPESALNDDAGKLLLDSYEDYAKRAQMMTSIHAQYKPTVFSSNNSISITPTSTSSTPSVSTSSTSQKIITSQVKSPVNINTITPASAYTSLVTPLAVSKSKNESESANGLKKISTSAPPENSSPSVTPKKRAGDKKLDKKQVDKKRSLKRL